MYNIIHLHILCKLSPTLYPVNIRQQNSRINAPTNGAFNIVGIQRIKGNCFKINAANVDKKRGHTTRTRSKLQYITNYNYDEGGHGCIYSLNCHATVKYHNHRDISRVIYHKVETLSTKIKLRVRYTAEPTNQQAKLQPMKRLDDKVHSSLTHALDKMK